MGFLDWLENTGFSVWVRDSNSPFAYTLFLYLHSVGMAFLVGLSTVIGLRILGLAPRLPLAPMASFFPLIVISFWVNASTGVVLLAINATEFLLQTPILYVKLAAIAGAVVCLRRLKKQVLGDPRLNTGPVPKNGRVWAGAMIACWTIAVISGRLTAYVYYVVFSTIGACLAVAVSITVAALMARKISRLVGSSGAIRQDA